jgi:hypothetical protein
MCMTAFVAAFSCWSLLRISLCGGLARLKPSAAAPQSRQSRPDRLGWRGAGPAARCWQAAPPCSGNRRRVPRGTRRRRLRGWKTSLVASLMPFFIWMISMPPTWLLGRLARPLWSRSSSSVQHRLDRRRSIRLPARVQMALAGPAIGRPIAKRSSRLSVGRASGAIAYPVCLSSTCRV